MFPWSPNGSSSSSATGQTAGPTDLDMLAGGQHLHSTTLSPAAAGSSVSNSNRSQFVYTRSNHNSVLGLGAYAAAAGAQLVPQSDQGVEDWVASLEQQAQPRQGQGQEAKAGGPTYNLLAYPAEDNFAGVLFPLDWINRVSGGGCGCRLGFRASLGSAAAWRRVWPVSWLAGSAALPWCPPVWLSTVHGQ